MYLAVSCRRHEPGLLWGVAFVETHSLLVNGNSHLLVLEMWPESSRRVETFGQ